MNSTELRGAKVWNNTIFNVNRSRNAKLGAIANDANGKPGFVDVSNNIIWPFPGTLYAGGSTGFGGAESTWTNNLFFGGLDPSDAGATTWGKQAVLENPKFVGQGFDFRLSPGSPAKDRGAPAVSGVVTNDFVGTPRPQGAGIDIGAYELP